MQYFASLASDSASDLASLANGSASLTSDSASFASDSQVWQVIWLVLQVTWKTKDCGNGIHAHVTMCFRQMSVNNNKHIFPTVNYPMPGKYNMYI
ncbi:hypothetical protein WA026_005725 [Henosepilachna vigintioctopunctata]|uniref:Uncharacterized protein n=1 Tax=Henosepilachna vigintioctopunctata TaxID=420089 RepID=A0AAW1TVV6_9CUCU